LILFNVCFWLLEHDLSWNETWLWMSLKEVKAAFLWNLLLFAPN
jgi:hypothetical protein